MYFLIYANNALGIHNIFTSRHAHKFFDKFVQDTSSPPLHRSSPYSDPFDPHTYLRIRIQSSIWIYDLILQESSD